MPANLCEHCTAVCCRYVALPIETPETDADFDDVRWYLLHEGVSVFVEDDDWYISLTTNCRHLQPDFRCGIYETRPKICRKYSTDNCDYHSGDYGWQAHFTCPEHLDLYRRQQKLEKRQAKAIGKSKKSSGAGGRGRQLQVKLRNRVLAAKQLRKLPPKRPEPQILVDRDIRGMRLPVLIPARMHGQADS
jgi:Fe-S-cluster containining protein